jgi:hypothetical protein
MRSTQQDEAQALLFPEHREDLKKSGLSDDIIQQAGLHSVKASALAELIGWVPPEVKSALVFPYHGETDGFCRVKVFPPYTAKDGSTARYLQRKESGSRLYVPSPAQPVLSNPVIPLLWTEGEKKALKACQEGLSSLALGGLWNWRVHGQPALWLDSLAYANRPITIAPDSDVWARPDLIQAVYAFGKELELRGAIVNVLIIVPAILDTGIVETFREPCAQVGSIEASAADLR